MSAGALTVTSPSWGPIPAPRPANGGRAAARLAAPRAALVEARPRGPPQEVRDGGGGGGGGRGGAVVPVLRVDRAEDIQAEARAMARAANATVYTPELLSRRYGRRPLKVAGRALEIVVALGSFAIKLLVDQSNGQIDQNKRKRGAELRRIFTRLGPTFVKIGQGLSTRPDLCPPEYLDELSELQMRRLH
ncbi:protein ACTIVITY OF BC1 COMPLEX KINASE 3, chloroplastic-like isoform X2 [Syzygium oleosum]|uniref:protein ACTIVITY OF BC1 COMPLEX KINASE 3, chloroplastic-like isoform X2 n=1 Tax=Syzygium oleosum TaxID=219896 RepID=UPI0024BA9148|nr:protein ACTIVITY OF BC1 COMPLEX KINASE 3, chloroplastic-like isoform X2 [Syzygium oleosum]